MKDKLLLALKGIAMGAADVVPGVSGGTIAFISGIYEELLSSVSSFDAEAVKLLIKGQFKNFWNHINGDFLLPLFLGIGISVASLAKAITYLLKNHPILVWAFFFGLIVASVIFVGKQVKKWNTQSLIASVIGIAIAFWITISAPSQIPDGLFFIFLAGSVAICAMILPGISGSFILLLMGAYATVLGAVNGTLDSLKAFDVDGIISNGTKLATFMLGCVVGLGLFSRVLTWMFNKAHDITVALLTGFMIGSLNKVWPWKLTTQTRLNSHGEEVPFLQDNVLPMNYIDGEPLILLAVIMAIVGFGLVFGLERLAVSKDHSETIDH